MFIGTLKQGTTKLRKKYLIIIVNAIETINRKSKDANKQTPIKCKMKESK
jgi:hypothetical protein